MRSITMTHVIAKPHYESHRQFLRHQTLIRRTNTRTGQRSRHADESVQRNRLANTREFLDPTMSADEANGGGHTAVAIGDTHAGVQDIRLVTEDYREKG